MQTGGRTVLTDAEKRLDDRLFGMKQKEVMRADFPPAMHFFKARPLIRGSPIFSMLQKMPKGARIKGSNPGVGTGGWEVCVCVCGIYFWRKVFNI